MIRLLCILLLVASPVLAEQDNGVVMYSQTILRLIPKPEPKPIISPMRDPEPLSKKESPKGKLYTKADLKKEQELKVKAEQQETPPAPPAPPPRVPIDFTVEIKSPDYLQQTDFITHGDMPPHEGIFIQMDPVAIATITATHMVGKSDVIFVNEDGFITKIAPNLDLEELVEPISSGQPVLGVLYVKAGTVEEDRIVPGDHFENPMFKTHPVTIQ